MALTRLAVRCAAFAVALLLLTSILNAQTSTQGPAPEVPEPETARSNATAAPFDPSAATDAYLATVAGEKRERSDAYFEGGYWLQVWDFLLGVAVNLGLLATGISRGMRDRVERVVRFRPLQTLLYWVQYLLVTVVVLFPMTVYEGFVREHQYGLSNQTFASWLGDQGKGLGVGLILGGLGVMTIYGVVRRTPRTWAVWGAATMIAFFIFTVMISP